MFKNDEDQPMDMNYFYPLVNVNNKRKLRACLKCREKFVSHHLGHRVCGACKNIIKNQGKLAEQLPIVSQHYEPQEMMTHSKSS